MSAAFSSDFADSTGTVSDFTSSLEGSFIMNAIATGLHGGGLMVSIESHHILHDTLSYTEGYVMCVCIIISGCALYTLVHHLA